MPSGVIRLRNSKKTQQNPRVVYPVVDNSGVHPVEYRDDSTLRKDVHPNPWAPEGQNPRAPYPVVKGQGYHREMETKKHRADELIRPPQKPKTFKKYTDPHGQYVEPKAIDDFDDKPEGKIRSRQADKGSKGKQ